MLPAWVSARIPRARRLLHDGYYLTAWPVMAGLLPPLALLIGAVAGFSGR